MISLSDITTSTGKQICPYAVKGVRHPHRPSTYKWPNQNTIGSKFWRIWETCVKYTFCSIHTKLKNPLKEWIDGVDPSQQWKTYADHNTGNLIWITGQSDSQQCREHKRVPTSKFLVYNRDKKGTIMEQPNMLYKISLMSQSPRTWLFQKIRERPSDREPRNASTASNILKKQTYK